MDIEESPWHVLINDRKLSEVNFFFPLIISFQLSTENMLIEFSYTIFSLPDISLIFLIFSDDKFGGMCKCLLETSLDYRDTLIQPITLTPDLSLVFKLPKHRDNPRTVYPICASKLVLYKLLLH